MARKQQATLRADVAPPAFDSVRQFLDESVNDNPIAPGPIMTTKQARKSYLNRTRGPRLSKEEQRRQELAELARIKREEAESRKQRDKERAANKARIQREKKKEKEQKERDEKRKMGLPLTTVHPSQDIITRFFRDNANPRKRQREEDAIEEEEAVYNYGYTTDQVVDENQSSEAKGYTLLHHSTKPPPAKKPASSRLQESVPSLAVSPPAVREAVDVDPAYESDHLGSLLASIDVSFEETNVPETLPDTSGGKPSTATLRPSSIAAHIPSGHVTSFKSGLSVRQGTSPQDVVDLIGSFGHSSCVPTSYQLPRPEPRSSQQQPRRSPLDRVTKRSLPTPAAKAPAYDSSAERLDEPAESFISIRSRPSSMKRPGSGMRQHEQQKALPATSQTGLVNQASPGTSGPTKKSVRWDGPSNAPSHTNISPTCDQHYTTPQKSARSCQSPSSLCVKPANPAPAMADPPMSTQSFIMNNFEDLFPSASQEAAELGLAHDSASRAVPTKTLGAELISPLVCSQDLIMSTQDLLELEEGPVRVAVPPEATTNIEAGDTSACDISIAEDLAMFGSQLLADSDIDSVEADELANPPAPNPADTGLDQHALPCSTQQAVKIMFQCMSDESDDLDWSN